MTPDLFHELLPAATAIAGSVATAIAIGVVGETRQLMAYRRKRHEMLRRLLHELLELRFGLYDAMPDKDVPLLVGEYLRKRFPGPEGVAAATVLAPIMIKVETGRAAEAQQRLRDSDFPQQYGRAIADLSRHDPILAYQLRGQERAVDLGDNLTRMMEVLESSLSAAGVTPSQQAEIAEGKSAAGPAVLHGLTRQVMDDIGAQARRIAWRISLLEWWKTRSIVGRQDDAVVRKRFEKFMNRWLSRPEIKNLLDQLSAAGQGR